MGDAQALTALAHMYLEGTGVDRDEDKAHVLFEQAASKVGECVACLGVDVRECISVKTARCPCLPSSITPIDRPFTHLKDNAEALFYYGERLAGEGDLFGAAAAYHRSGAANRLHTCLIC